MWDCWGLMGGVTTGIGEEWGCCYIDRRWGGWVDCVGDEDFWGYIGVID